MPTPAASLESPPAAEPRRRTPVRRGSPLLDDLRASPIALPCLGAVIVLLAWTPDHAGFGTTTWLAGGLVILALLAIAAWTIPTRLADVPVPVRVAAGAMAGFTVWSYLTIAWADDQGAAWEAANRTLLYLAVFALFALWRMRGSPAAAVLGTWTLGMGILALVTVVRLGSAKAPADLFYFELLDYPAGYHNAAAAVWLMAPWPAVALAAARGIPWPLRGTFAAAAVLVLDLGLLAQSRGAVVATPIVLALWFALFGDRVRRLVALTPVAIAVAAGAPTLLHVADKLSASNLDGARSAALGGALIAGLVVAAWAYVEARGAVSEGTERTLHRAVGAAGLALVAVVVVGGLIAIGNPARRIDNAWHSFKGGYSEKTLRGGSGRLLAGFGSNRYDFYRVGLDLFKDHPLTGVGGDNFAQPYLVRGRSDETPLYPHSLEIRTLSQTGLIGAALLLTALIAAFVGAWRGARSADSLARAAVAGAAGTALYFLAHGSGDWFWEYAGLGAAAFAMLGLACGMAPRPSAPYRGFPPALGGRVRGIAGGLVIGLMFLALGSLWWSERQVERAARIWPNHPSAAFSALDTARSLNPFGDHADLVRGAISVRLNSLQRAQEAYTRAANRNPRNEYAALELGAIAGTLGDQATAVRQLQRAVELSPRDAVAKDALEKARAGRRLNVTKTNLALQRQASAIARP